MVVGVGMDAKRFISKTIWNIKLAHLGDRLDVSESR
jgi:hypothetical protein